MMHEDSALGAGSHELLWSGVPCRGIPTTCLFLAHFPVRSLAQIKRKVEEGWKKIQANPRRGEEEGYHWGTIAEYFSDGQEKSQEDLTEIARSYSSPTLSSLVFDPVC